MHIFRKTKTKLYNYKKQPEKVQTEQIKEELINIMRNAPFLYIGEMTAIHRKENKHGTDNQQVLR